MKNKILFVCFLCLFPFSPAFAGGSEGTYISGWYAGVGMGTFNAGGSIGTLAKGTAGIRGDDTADSPVILKVGYQMENRNRVEGYFKKDIIGADSLSVDFDVSTVGMNYQWGLSSLASGSVIPYLRIGGGLGTADVTGSDVVAAEIDLGAGLHVGLTDNLGLSAGVYRRSMALIDEDYDSSIGFSMNGGELGISYLTY